MEPPRTERRPGGDEKENVMENPNNRNEIAEELLADLSPEELEPRLELQVFIDPMASIVTAANNNNNNNN